MAIPAPNWKRKTRPCPFYSQGRCLFADSCNFIHSVKIQNESSQSISDVFTSDIPSLDEDDRPSRLPAGLGREKDAELRENGDLAEGADSRASKAFRRSYKSPPRSPRLSGLLFALEPVIGPDVDDEEDEESMYIDPDPELADVSDALSGEEVSIDERSSVSAASPGLPKPHPEILLSGLSMDDDLQASEPPPVLTPMDGSFNLTADGPGFSFLSDFPAPPSSLPLDSASAVTSTPKRSPSLRLQISSPASPDALLVENTADYTLEAGSTMTENQLAASSTAPQSTFDLLSSPFASPVKRAFSPSIFPSSRQVSPRKMPLELEAESSSYSPIPGPSYFDGEVDSLPSSHNGSPNPKADDTEEKQDNSRTPRNSKYMGSNGTATDRTIPIPLAALSKPDAVPRLPLGPGDEDLTITAQSQYDESFTNPPSMDDPPADFASSFRNYPSFEQFVEMNRSSNGSFSEEDEGTGSDSSSPVSSTFRRLSSYDEHGTLGSVMDYYSDPSPISSNVHSSNTSETLVEVDAQAIKLGKEDLFLPPPPHAFVEVSPIQETPVDSRPPSVEPHRFSPANREPPNSAPPIPGSSSSHPSWNDVSRRGTSSQKVPFGFRHSVLPTHASSSSQSHRLSKVSDSSTARPRLRVSTKSPAFPSIEAISQRSRSMSPVVHANTRRPSWMRPLHLSQVPGPDILLDSQPSSSSSHRSRFSNVSSSSSHPSSLARTNVVPQERHVSSSSLSSARSSLISSHDQDTAIPAHDISPLIMGPDGLHLRTRSSLYQSTIHSHSHSGLVNERGALELDLLSPLSGSMQGFDFEEYPSHQPPASMPPSLPTTRPASSLQIQAPPHAIATPRPTLMFAIASDDPAAVEQVLASGEVRPNDDIGPQSALEFALTNDALSHRTEIVKTLLAYGADPSTLPSALRDALSGADPASGAETPSSTERRRDSMNPAMKYYLKRARSPEAQRSTAAIRRSFFRPLTRIRFDFVGQDRALEQLYWVLNIHSQQPIASPLVVLCCGPSGHGKSLLARKFGSLLEVPTHTVNMTILKSAHDLWQCPSMSPYDEPSNRTLAEFLSENEGKRCIVVLDEIDKNEDERNLWSLLAPWELGRCPIDGGRRHIDVRNVIWLGTSNIGQDQIFEYFEARDNAASDVPLTREEYRELMALLRPRVSAKLGTSLMSRVTAVLPFIPFSSEEKMAIASEALLSLGSDFAKEMSSEEFEQFTARSVSDYVPTEGARSLYRSISNHLMEGF